MTIAYTKAQWAEATLFRQRRRSPLPQQIADDLRRRIVTGNLRTDARLPNLHRLAGLYGVSVPTMHAAIHALVALGLVRSRHGVGLFVSRPKSMAALLNHAWLNATLEELAIMRAQIDWQAPPLAARAVATATSRRPRAAGDLLFLVAERDPSQIQLPATFIRADLAFHRTIASCIKGYEVTVSLHDTLGQRLFPAMMASAEAMAADHQLTAAHHDVARAVIDGRAVAAARAARLVSRREAALIGLALG